MDRNELDELLIYEQKLYVKAFKKGLSVTYICRTLNFDNMERVYAVLRREGVVPLLPTRQRYSIPPLLDGGLRKAKHSFPKWCAGYSFDLKKAEYAINTGPYDAEDEYSQRVFDALKDDFYNVYERLYGNDNIFNMRITNLTEEDRSRFNCHIEWLEEEGVYRASVPELMEMVAYGTCWDSALKELKTVFNTKRRVYRLEAMIQHGKDWKKY